VIPRLHDTTGSQTGCTTGLTTGCIVLTGLDRQTDRQRYSVCNNGPHLRSTAKRPKSELEQQQVRCS